MASEALGFQSSPEGLQRETMVSRKGFHVLMNCSNVLIRTCSNDCCHGDGERHPSGLCYFQD